MRDAALSAWLGGEGREHTRSLSDHESPCHGVCGMPRHEIHSLLHFLYNTALAASTGQAMRLSPQGQWGDTAVRLGGIRSALG